MKRLFFPFFISDEDGCSASSPCKFHSIPKPLSYINMNVFHARGTCYWRSCIAKSFRRLLFEVLAVNGVLVITAQKGRECGGKEWVGIMETSLNEGAYVPRSSRYEQGIANQQVRPQEDGPAASSSTNYSLAIAFLLLPWLIYTPKDFWSVFI